MRPLPFLVFAFALTVSEAPGGGGAAADDAAGWSDAVNGLRARLSVRQTETFNDTPILTTYLELQNVRDLGNVMEVADILEHAEFTVTNAAGKVVAPADGPFDSLSVELGVIRLPHDSLLRFNIAQRGAGVSRGLAAHLDLGPLAHWNFKAGDETYYLQAKLTVKERADQRWSGTLVLPRTRLPVGKASK
jgi:hypothetical protein